ncbi:MAG: enoyl-CoA hydratase/isomerase family protein [Deltaproteobacteria bacterium]|nr:enoyl-CoA hydratase/isomerase family protein [Deltaproteobacteria bacterium]
MELKTLLLDMTGGIATITLNRPQALNAMSLEMQGELEAVLDRVEREDAVRVVILTGAGEKAFMAGADIGDFRGMTGPQAVRYSQRIQGLVTRLERLGRPVIAAVNGFALGGGCELAMACDIIYAAETARFGQPEINLGIIPGAGGTQRLPRLIGKQRAKELIFTGDLIDAREAYRLGLVGRVVPLADLQGEVRALAEKLATKAPVALRLAKEAVEEGSRAGLESGLALEAKAWGVCFSTADKEEGVAAFLEKRPPAFKGC